MFVLELKKDTTNTETFYRYGMGKNKVWFTQSKSGDIYSVYFAGDEKLSGLDFYIHIEQQSIYYPYYVCIQTSSVRLFEPKEIDEYIDKMKYAKKVSELIMEIFKADEHSKYMKDFER